MKKKDYFGDNVDGKIPQFLLAKRSAIIFEITQRLFEKSKNCLKVLYAVFVRFPMLQFVFIVSN
jgi:hypothetical protein